MQMYRILFLLIVNFIFVTRAYSQVAKEDIRENVVAQMNYCITSLTNIIHNKSMSVLSHESDQLVNNLTMEQIVGLYEIKDFRIELLDAVGKFEITEEERVLMRRLQSMKRNNMKWAALSNALNPTMLLTGGVGPGMGIQAAFQVLLTAARSVVEYKTMQGEQNMEELRAMWELRKEDLKTINDVRKSAQSIIFELYNKYHLSENDRLTEATANMFNDYISENDAYKRTRLLEDNKEIYKSIPDYYYHLGMAYVDIGQYEKAKANFLIYLDLYNRAPILRYDEKSGCIALTMLTYEKNMSDAEKESLISIALKNLPGNSAAILQCAMTYFYDLKQEEKAAQILRIGLDDPRASDIEILFMAASNLLPIIANYPKVYAEICESFNHAKKINLDSYILYLINSREDKKDPFEAIAFKSWSHRRWYQLWIGKYFNKKLQIVLPENIAYNHGDISLFIEHHKEGQLSINQMTPTLVNGVPARKIEKIDCFKANKNLKYLFVDVLVPNQFYTVKPNIDYDKIKREEWPRMSEFTLSQDDIDDIVDFCKDNMVESKNTILKSSENSGKYCTLDSINGVAVKFKGDSLLYKPHHSFKQHGHYIRIVLSNGVNLMYRYNEAKDEIQPYLYSINDVVVFADDDSRAEYEYKEDVEESSLGDGCENTNFGKDPWWKKTWFVIRDFFKSLWD